MNVTRCSDCTDDSGPCITCGDLAPNICGHVTKGRYVYLCSEHRYAAHLAVVLRGGEINPADIAHDVKHLDERK